jgi:BirA family transcriptional regulator, biotin operon repressor / biotin---[acetyl-CoA-carboxylase] ligase
MHFEIFKYKKVKSTNDIAINLIKQKKKKAGCVLAKIQTKGRGTRGKKWVSTEGNFFGTIFFRLDKKYPKFHEFSIINPIIISSVIQHFCRKKDISLKWPNDILVNKKKICGILQELITINNIQFLVIGIGINVLSNPYIKNIYKTTNIFKESKKKPSMDKIIKLIISSYKKFFTNLNNYNLYKFKKKAKLI